MSHGNNSNSSKGHNQKNFSSNNVIKLNQIIGEDESYAADPMNGDDFQISFSGDSFNQDIQKRRFSKGEASGYNLSSKLSFSTSAG